MANGNPDEVIDIPDISALEILRFQKGDTLIVRVDLTTEDQVKFILGALGALLHKQGYTTEDIHILMVPSNVDIKRLDADQMKRQGWVRANRIELARGNNHTPLPGPQPR